MRTLGPRMNADERNLLAELNAAIDNDGEDGGAVDGAGRPDDGRDLGMLPVAAAP